MGLWLFQWQELLSNTWMILIWFILTIQCHDIKQIDTRILWFITQWFHTVVKWLFCSMQPGTFPKSLCGYVERALGRCKGDMQMEACQDFMKEVSHLGWSHWTSQFCTSNCDFINVIPTPPPPWVVVRDPLQHTFPSPFFLGLVICVFVDHGSF